MQRRLLPAQPPCCAAATFAAFTLAARTVGGDYYDFLELPGERIGIAVADIAGKGIAGGAAHVGVAGIAARDGGGA